MTARRLLTALLAVLPALAPLWAPTVVAQPGGLDLQAHRGGRGETTENSLRAFAKSLELGVSTLELDVVLTEDAQPLVWHDPVIEPAKCTDTGPVFAGDPQYPYVGAPVGELTAAQIATLDCDVPLPEFPDAEVVRGNKIATLPEVFALTDAYRADVRYNIETKVQPDQSDISARRCVEVILAAVRAAGKIAQVEIQSFDWRTLSMVRATEPSIPRVALFDESFPGDPVRHAIAAGASVLAPDYRLSDRAFVDRAHTLGLKVIAWTVNDPEVMRAQIADGVDGIITDYPGRLRAVLGELGMAVPPAYRR